ncbi:MAG: hypothetical protein ABIO38_02940 [Luteimonas sp.]
MIRPYLAVPVLALAAFASAASAETLLIERVQAEARTAMPTRGMNMGQVQARYGAPTSRLEPRGGQKRQWPTINRWMYPGFTVYFEKSKVIDVVANQSGTNEIGPKPAIR